jgi:hypothetical protein
MLERQTKGQRGAERPSLRLGHGSHHLLEDRYSPAGSTGKVGVRQSHDAGPDDGDVRPLGIHQLTIYSLL